MWTLRGKVGAVLVCASFCLPDAATGRIYACVMAASRVPSTYLLTCYQRGSPCQDPAGNRTTRRPPDHRKETQTAVVRSCLPFIRSGQNHLASIVKRGRRQGRQRKRGEDIIREWTGLEFAKSLGAVENRGKWMKLVAKSSVVHVPQRPSRLRDR